MKSYIFLLFAFIPIIVCSQKQDYDIYSTVLVNELKESYHSRLDKIEEVVIVEKVNVNWVDMSNLYEMTQNPLQNEDFITTYYRDIAKRFLSEIDIRRVVADVTKDFKNQSNIDSSQIIISFQTIKIRSIRQSNEISEIYDQRKFNPVPLPIFGFSRINYKGNFAALYLERNCGSICGEGKIVVLEKVNDQWGIVGDMIIWVA